MIRRVLLAAARGERARELVTATSVARRVAARFVAGERPADALDVVRVLAADGITATVDWLAPPAASVAAAREATVAYLGLLDLAQDAGLAAGLDVSVRLAALGRSVPYGGEKICYEDALEICARAAALGATVTLDAQEHTSVGPALDLLADLRRDFPLTGTALQAHLRRTPEDCRDLAGTACRVRLHAGADGAPRQGALTRRRDLDASFTRCLETLLAGGGYPMVATHDPGLLAVAARLATEHRRAPDSFEYQLAHGVRPHEQLRLVSRGARVRVRLPYGADWYPYLLRRLADRPAKHASFARLG